MNGGMDFKHLFDTAPGRFLVLATDDPKYTILAVTDEYLAATLTKREDIIGKGIFEVFPDNPANPATRAVDKARASFQRVIGLRSTDAIGITEHDVRRSDGTFETRWWDTTNFPILDPGGEVAGVIHRVEDVTKWEIQRHKLALQDSAFVALKDARRAALNLMEDAVETRRQADEVNEQLKREIKEHKAAETEILALSRFPMENPNPVLRIGADGILQYANPASSILLTFWQISKGDKLPADLAIIVNETLVSGKHRQLDWSFGGRSYDFVFAPVPEEGYVNLYARDSTERKKTEERVARLTSIHSVLSRVNEVIVRVNDKNDLFDEACRIIAEEGYYPLVWIGEVKGEDIVPVASSGAALNYLHDIRVEVHGALGKGPTGTSIRANKPVINYNFESNPAMTPWLSKAKKYGLASSAAFPLCLNDKPIAALTVYASEPDAFDPETADLFESLSEDLSYALDAINGESLKNQAESALRESEEKFSKYFHQSPVAMTISLVGEGKWVDVNQAYSNLVEYSREELLSHTSTELNIIESDEREKLVGIIQHNGKLHGDEIAVRTKNGKCKWTAYSTETVAIGGRSYTISTISDITERKKAEEALKKALQDIDAHFSNSPLAIIEFDAQYRITRWSEGAQRIFGWTADEVLGKAIGEFRWVVEEDTPAVDKVSAEMLSGQNPRNLNVNRNYRKDGSIITCEWYNSAVFDDSGNMVSVLSQVLDITERKKAEAALKESEEKYRNLFGCMSEGFAVHEIIIDSTGKPCDYRYLEINEAFTRLTGMTSSQAVGHTVRELMPDIEDYWIDTYGKVALNGQPTRFENFSAPLGKWYEVYAYSPQPNHFAVVFTDITERKQAAEALQLSQARYRNLVEETVDGIFVADAQGHYVDVNQAGAAMLGYTPEELLKLTLVDLLAPEELARLPGQITELAGAAVVRNEWLFRRKDGTTFTGELVGRQLPDGRLHGILRDTTDRKRAEHALKASEERLSRSQEIAHLGSWELDLIQDKLTWSDEVYRIFGLSPQEFGATYEAFLSYIYPEDLQKVNEAYIGSLRAGCAGYEVEHRVIRQHTGEVRIVHEKCEHFRDDNGKTIRSVGMVHDITERKKAEDALKESEERFFKSFYASPAGMTIARLPEGRWTQVNDAFLRLTGYSREELIGHTSLEFNILTEPAERGAVMKSLEETGRAQNEHTARRKDGQLITVLAASEKINIGGNTYNIASFMDITDRKNAERMKDEFIGMISHELKTPMTVVIGALSTATMPGLTEKVKDDLFRDAVNHADILASIVDNLLELSRFQSKRLELRKKPTDVGEIACKVTGQLSKKSAIHGLKCDFPERLPKIPADPIRVERILYNLVENAIKYSPAGGEVRVSGSVCDGYLQISVSDQGIGISAENLPRLFQPFERLGFDVKGAIQGTGLGLRVCRILTEAHGGKIWVEATPGKGSTFYFTLPVG